GSHRTRAWMAGWPALRVCTKTLPPPDRGPDQAAASIHVARACSAACTPARRNARSGSRMATRSSRTGPTSLTAEAVPTSTVPGPGAPGRTVLPLGWCGLDQGSVRPLRRPVGPGLADRPVVDLRHGVDRGGERGEDAGGAMDAGSSHRHLAHVIVGSPVLSVPRVDLAADPDEAEVRDGGEDAGPSGDDHVVPASQDLEPRSVPGSRFAAQEGHRPVRELLQHC